MTSFGDRFSYAVIGRAVETHRELGPGLDEAFYHELLAEKLQAAGIPHQFKPRGRLLHHGILADEFEPDLIIGDELVAELKVLRGDFAPENLLQIICYLKFWKLQAGLLFDFGKESLVTKRVPYLERVVDSEIRLREFVVPADSADTATIELLTASLSAILEGYGLGYPDTTYRGLVLAELSHLGVECVGDPQVPVRTAVGVLGEAKLPCLVLPGRCALLITSLRDSRGAADRAVLQTYLKHLSLPWGLHLNFGKERLQTQFVTQPRTMKAQWCSQ